MSTFFKALAIFMKDRQEYQMKATKIKDDLVLMITPDLKGHGGMKHITIPAADLEDENLDSKIFGELGPPTETKAAYQISETPAPKAAKDNVKADAKPTVKKAAPKKTAKKPLVKKAAPAKKAVNSAKPSRASKSVTKKPAKPVKTGNSKSGKKSTESVQNLTNNEMKQPLSEIIPPKSETTEAPLESQTPKQIFDKLMDEGEKLQLDRSYRAAELKFTEAVALYPDNPEALKQLAKAKKWADAFEEAAI